MTTPHEGIRRTLAAYCLLCDDGRFEEWGELFTEDTRFHVMGTTHHGRAGATGFIEAGQPPERRGTHVVSSSIIEVDPGASTARAWSDYLFVDRNGAIINVGRYHDELVCDDDGVWRFSLREIVFKGDEPQLTPRPLD